MRLIHTRPRYHCDFCSHTSTRAAMEAHEMICWLNPKRHCASCNDTWVYPGEYLGDGLQMPDEPCYYCKKLTPDSDAAELLKAKMPRLIKELVTADRSD